MIWIWFIHFIYYPNSSMSIIHHYTIFQSKDPRWAFNLGCSARFSSQTPSLKTWRAKVWAKISETMKSRPHPHFWKWKIKVQKNRLQLLVFIQEPQTGISRGNISPTIRRYYSSFVPGPHPPSFAFRPPSSVLRFPPFRPPSSAFDPPSSFLCPPSPSSVLWPPSSSVVGPLSSLLPIFCLLLSAVM